MSAATFDYTSSMGNRRLYCTEEKKHFHGHDGGNSISSNNNNNNNLHDSFERDNLLNLSTTPPSASSSSSSFLEMSAHTSSNIKKMKDGAPSSLLSTKEKEKALQVTTEALEESRMSRRQSSLRELGWTCSRHSVLISAGAEIGFKNSVVWNFRNSNRNRKASDSYDTSSPPDSDSYDTSSPPVELF